MNERHNVVAVNVAAWSRNERLNLTRHIFGGLPRDTMGGRGELSALTVQGMPLDKLLTELSIKPRLVKIDVEGAESQVLSGMATTLRTSRPMLIVETLTKEALAALEAWGYDVRCIHDGYYRATPRSGIDGQPLRQGVVYELG